MSKYELIHIDTLESVMCKKYTIGGFDYYVKANNELDATQLGALNHFYQILNNTIATTNSDLDLLPQVVDEVFLEWDNSLKSQLKSMDKSLLYDYPTGRNAFFWGYKSHAETHSLSDKEVFRFLAWFLNNPKLINSTMTKTLALFKSTLPIKVYYK